MEETESIKAKGKQMFRSSDKHLTRARSVDVKCWMLYGIQMLGVKGGGGIYG